MSNRSDASFLRIYGPPPYREWGYRRPCLVVGCKTRTRRPGSRKIIEQCHVAPPGVERGKGMAHKADWTWTVWLCWRHHDEADGGRERFERAHALRVDSGPEQIDVASLEEAALVTQTLFHEWEDGLAY